ncbi:hypothetical protein DPEC_G00057090, partial [Dallia pectoralis]
AESSKADELEEEGLVQRSQRKKRSKKENEEERGEEYSDVLLNSQAKKRSRKNTLDTQKSDDGMTSGALTPEPCCLEGEAPEGQVGVSGPLQQELTARLKELVSQGRLSLSDDELDRPVDDQREIEKGRLRHLEMEGGREKIEEETAEVREGGNLKLTLIELASQISATEFSSTENELDEEEREKEKEGE